MPFLPISLLGSSITTVLAGSDDAKSAVNTQLTAVLGSQLIAAAQSAGNDVLASMLQKLSPADLAADQNLSLRDFVTKHATLPTDPAAAKAAQAAIATLSSTTTVGALLQLSANVSDNPALAGIVAQTNLAALLGTSPALADSKLQTDFINKYTAFQGTSQQFWPQLSADVEFKAAVPELQLTVQLGTLTLNNPALVSALRTAYKPTSVRDLSKLDTATLNQIITSQKVATPPEYRARTPTSNSRTMSTE